MESKKETSLCVWGLRAWIVLLASKGHSEQNAGRHILHIKTSTTVLLNGHCCSKLPSLALSLVITSGIVPLGFRMATAAASCPVPRPEPSYNFLNTSDPGHYPWSITVWLPLNYDREIIGEVPKSPPPLYPSHSCQEEIYMEQVAFQRLGGCHCHLLCSFHKHASRGFPVGLHILSKCKVIK